MKTSLRVGVVVVAFAAVAGAVSAQEEAPGPFVYSTYYVCDAGEQWKADGLVDRAFEPAYVAAIAAGKVTSWGWMAHHTGGAWRRAMYYSAPTLEALFAASDAIDAEIEKADSGAEADELGRICNSHEDYIWESVSGSGQGQLAEKRGAVGFSVYMICDESKEDRADELFATVYAPLYAQQVADGNLVTWGWLQHWVGGKYRRLVTMTAKDLAGLLKARDGVIGKAQESAAEAVQEFSGICNGHQDYIWEIQSEKP